MISLILETVSNFVLMGIDKTGYLGVFFLMALESANIPIPSEIIMPFSGFLASQSGTVFSAGGGSAFGGSFWILVFIGALGNLTGSLFSYWLGYLIRHNILHWNSHRVNAEVERAQKWLDKWGDLAIFISRLLPVVRTFISFPLGILKTKSLWRFSWLTFLGSFIWSGFLVYLGFALGKNWQALHIYFQKFDYLIVIIVIAGGLWFIWDYWRKSNKVIR